MLSTIIRAARKRRGLSCATVDHYARLLPGTCQMIEKNALTISDHEVLRGIAAALDPVPDAQLALYVSMLMAAGVLTVTDIEAWAEYHAEGQAA